MAVISVTAANVVPDAGYTYRDMVAGATLTAGMSVYADAADSNKVKGAISTTAATANCIGILLNGASNNQPCRVMTGGTITIGGTVAIGETYSTSDTAGGIGPEVDMGANDFGATIGMGISTTKIKLGINVSGVAHA